MVLKSNSPVRLLVKNALLGVSLILAACGQDLGNLEKKGSSQPDTQTSPASEPRAKDSLSFTFTKYKNPNTGITEGPGNVYSAATSWGQVSAWVPEGMTTVMGIIVYGNGFGNDGQDVLYQPNYQAMARRLGWILVGTRGLVWSNWDGGYGLLQSLSNIGAQSGHPEMVNAPIFYTGFSAAAAISFYFNGAHPAKTIGYVMNQASSGRSYFNAALKTPAIMIAGENYLASETQNQLSQFLRHYNNGGLWSFVIQEDAAHNRSFTASEESWVFAFLDAIIDLRYPEGVTPAQGPIRLKDIDRTQGWLVDYSSQATGLVKIGSYAAYPPGTAGLGWVPNRDIANLYRGFATFDKAVAMGIGGTAESPELRIDCFQLLGKRAVIQVMDGATTLGSVVFEGVDPNVRFSLANLAPGTYNLNILIGGNSAVPRGTAMPVRFTKK